jgi:2'-5' RNA ligase
VKGPERRVRAFIAVEVPSLEGTYPYPRPPERHVTLRFLGEVEETRLPLLAQAMERAAATERPFRIALGSVGAFPSPEAPRVVWVGIGEGAIELERLHLRLSEALAEAGVPPEPRPFTPHVTVMRVRGGRDRALALTLLRDLAGRPLAEGSVAEIVLFESRLLPEGARHLPRVRARLGGAG